MSRIPARTHALVAAALAAAALLGSLLPLAGCNAGSPAAPDGTRILIDYEYIPGTTNTTTGDFEARISVRVMDNTSNVPHVGVGVYFRVESGPGRFANTNVVETTEDGYAEDILIATGALSGHAVTVSAFSGEATSPTLTLDVTSGSTSVNLPPVAAFTLSPTTGFRINTDITVDVSTSTDSDCPTGKPTRFEVNWGDGSAVTQQDWTDTTATHRYTTARDYTISVKVVDCDGLSNTKTQTITVGS